MLGVTTSKRLGSIPYIPGYCLVTFNSVLNVSGLPATVASLVPLCAVYVCTDSVGAAGVETYNGDWHGSCLVWG